MRTRARLLAAGLLLACGTAHAQIFRAYLASDGNDVNPCTLPAPCRLLPAALNVLSDGGEIWMLDSANFNSATVTIGKSVSILAVPGAVGSIVALNAGPAISIAAAGLRVALRNVVIGPVITAAAGTHGVHMTGNSSLTIENSVVANLPQGAGVVVDGTGTLRVSNTTLRNNFDFAIVLRGNARGVISESRMLDNGSGGVLATGGITSGFINATVSDSVISGGNVGVSAYVPGTVASTARISLARSSIERTGFALSSYVGGASGTTQVSVGTSLIAGNTAGWQQFGTGSAIHTLGNNQMIGNGSSTGTLTPLAGE
jgi:hypothetical protein